MKGIGKCVTCFFLFLLMFKGHMVYAEEGQFASPSTAIMNQTPFYWVIGVVGGAIAITLIYVGYRKYKAEIRKDTKKGPNS